MKDGDAEGRVDIELERERETRILLLSVRLHIKRNFRPLHESSDSNDKVRTSLAAHELVYLIDGDKATHLITPHSTWQPWVGLQAAHVLCGRHYFALALFALHREEELLGEGA